MDAFVVDGRLQSIPTARAKRLVVLDWLAQEFEPGRRYSEAQVNLILGQRHADTAALRRYLVDEEFLTVTRASTGGPAAAPERRHGVTHYELLGVDPDASADRGPRRLPARRAPLPPRHRRPSVRRRRWPRSTRRGGCCAIRIGGGPTT